MSTQQILGIIITWYVPPRDMWIGRFCRLDIPMDDQLAPVSMFYLKTRELYETGVRHVMDENGHLLEPQSRFGGKPLKIQVVCPQNGTMLFAVRS